MAAHQQHHYVPKAYFQPWCGADKKMAYFHWEHGKFLCSRTSPRSAAKQTLLYILRGAPQDQIDAIEVAYFAKQVDDPGATVIRVIREQSIEALSNEQRKIWTRYLMALYARRPEKVEHARNRGRTILLTDLRGAEWYEALRTPNHSKTLEDCVEPWKVENFGMLAMPGLIDDEETRHASLAMRWWCFDFKDAANDLLTGDRPLLWSQGNQRSPFFLALPLAPRLGFFATKNSEIEAKLRSAGPTEFARQMNLSVIGQSAGYVYASHDGHAKFVQSRLKSE